MNELRRKAVAHPLPNGTRTLCNWRRGPAGIATAIEVQTEVGTQDARNRTQGQEHKR